VGSIWFEAPELTPAPPEAPQSARRDPVQPRSPRSCQQPQQCVLPRGSPVLFDARHVLRVPV